ncbi:MAG: nucleotide exchange factor GrpE, partial [Ruminiclostridium sp.]|nr:nucleotide exchange factor GrpE [Ruminiclostridium sp.]
MSRNKEKEKAKETEAAEEAIPPNGEETAEPAEQTEPKAEADPKDQEIAKLKDQLMRNIAEYDNYRKRTAKERTELTPEITARIVTE